MGLWGSSRDCHCSLCNLLQGGPIEDCHRSRSLQIALPVSDRHCLFVSSRTKTLIWQKDRTQKNESRIYLRSMLLPIQVDLFGPSRFPQTRNRQENGSKNIFPALHFHAPIFLPIPNRTTSHPRFLACSILQVDGPICFSRTKTLIWQKDRTQKNVSRIFLRSMFLPL
jgi:hypothetical protein